MSKGNKKLYLVKLQGMSSTTGVSYETSYVVANNTNEAYEKVRDYLDEKDYGFDRERELKTITLLADEDEDTDITTRLFL